MAGFPLTGVDPNDPIPGIRVEVRFAQGQGTGGGQDRAVLFLGNKTSAGSESTNTLGDPIADDADAVARFGRKSELYQMYRKFTAINKVATIYAIAVPEDGSATAASCTLTVANAATGTTTLIVELVGETFELAIVSGDAANTIAANIKAKFDEQINWPVNATVSTNVVTVTAANLGPRGDFIIDRLRTQFRQNVATTVTKSATTVGTADDDLTTALGKIETKNFYYQLNPKAPTSSASATDNGVGEHAAFITSQALPAIGIRNQMIFATVGSASQATTVAVSLNNPRVKQVWAQTCKLPPCMVAAMFTAALHAKEIAHPAANMTDYGKGASDVFGIPAPFDAGDIPTAAELRSCLNNGVTPLSWTEAGTCYVVRHITTRSLLSTGINDYRVRSGHIPSALDYAAIDISDAIRTTNQQWVADDPVEGQPPLEGVTTPTLQASIVRGRIDALVRFTGGPVLDPSVQQAMKDSVEVVRLTNGTSMQMRLEAVKPNDKTHILANQVDTGY